MGIVFPSSSSQILTPFSYFQHSSASNPKMTHRGDESPIYLEALFQFFLQQLFLPLSSYAITSLLPLKSACNNCYFKVFQVHQDHLFY